MPDRLSLALRVTCAFVAYHPLGNGSLTEAVVTGGVRWILIPPAVAELVFPALSLTLADAPRLLPSPEIVLSAGQLPSMPESPSAQDHLTTTLLSYQPAPFGVVVAVPESDG